MTFGYPTASYYYATTTFIVVAPYWADIDIRQYGAVYYRHLVDTTCIQNVLKIIEKEFWLSNFTVDTSLVVTFSEVRPYRHGLNLAVSSFKQ